MMRMFKAVALGLALPVLAAAPALADERFSLLDVNGDGQVTWEEFHEVNPNMPRVAFDNIDKGGKGHFTHQEWDAFVSSHGKSMGQGMGSGVAMPPKSENLPARDAMPPVVMPPKKPAAPGTGSPDMPLVMPPKAPKTTQGAPAPAGGAVPAPSTPAAPANPAAASPEMPLIMPPAKVAGPAPVKP